MLTYVVDAADRIVEIEGPWDAFAAQNGGPLLTRAAVLSRPLLSFVAGPETKEITRMLLARVRAGERVSLEFRCDSPTERRYLRLECFRLSDAAVHCATTLLRAEPRAAQALIGTDAGRSNDLLIVCSWCRRVRLDDSDWVEVEQAVAALGLFQETRLPRLSHGICPACGTLLRGGRGSTTSA